MKIAYSVPILRNIEVQDWNPFLREHIKDFAKKFRNTVGDNSYIKFKHILASEIRNGFEDSSLDDFLFDKLVYEVQDLMYLFNLSSEVTADSFCDKIRNKNYFNRKVATSLSSDEKLVSVRKNGNLVAMLFKLGIAELGDNRDKKTTFYVPVVLDFHNKIATVRMKKHNLSRTEINLKRIFYFVTEYMSRFTSLCINRYSETLLHKDVLYNLFRDETTKAEEIIKNSKAETEEKDLEDTSLEFLESLNISDPWKYTERIKSIYYQNLFQQLNDSDFHEGYIFGFTFFDRKLIRSATKNSSRKPVYSSEVYWNLKDVIHRYREVNELSVYWKFDHNNFESIPIGSEFKFVELSMKELSGTLELSFYKSSGKLRRLQERYVIYRVKRYI